MYKINILILSLVFSFFCFGNQKPFEKTIRCGISEIDIYETGSKGRFQIEDLAMGDSIDITFSLNKYKQPELMLSSIDHQLGDFFNTNLRSISLLCDHENLIDDSILNDMKFNQKISYLKEYKLGRYFSRRKTREESRIDIDLNSGRGVLYSKCRRLGRVSSIVRSEVSLDLAGCKILR